MSGLYTDLLRKKKSLFITNIVTGIDGSDQVIQCTSLAGCAQDTAITLTIDRVDQNGERTAGYMERVTGIVAGDNLIDCLRGRDNTTPRAHTVGAVVEDIWESSTWNDSVDAFLEEHNQDGTHNITSGVTLTEIDTPTNPDAGSVKLYAKTGDKLYYLNSAGTEKKVNLPDAADILAAVYPVGAIYISVVSTSPATLFGGTWSAWGAGKVPVGINAAETEFDTVEETGGSKTHTLDITQMPAHNHRVGGSGDNSDAVYNFNDIVGGGGVALTNVKTSPSLIVGDYISHTGGGLAHNNLQPYITCYMWKRTA